MPSRTWTPIPRWATFWTLVTVIAVVGFTVIVVVLSVMGLIIGSSF